MHSFSFCSIWDRKRSDYAHYLTNSVIMGTPLLLVVFGESYYGWEARSNGLRFTGSQLDSVGAGREILMTRYTLTCCNYTSSNPEKRPWIFIHRRRPQTSYDTFAFSYASHSDDAHVVGKTGRACQRKFYRCVFTSVMTSAHQDQTFVATWLPEDYRFCRRSFVIKN